MPSRGRTRVNQRRKGKGFRTVKEPIFCMICVHAFRTIILDNHYILYIIFIHILLDLIYELTPPPLPSSEPARSLGGETIRVAHYTCLPERFKIFTYFVIKSF